LWCLFIFFKSSANPSKLYEINTNNIIIKELVISSEPLIYKSNIAIIVGTININPPIVGVPSFCKCLSVIIVHTLCLKFSFFSIGNKIKPANTDKKNPIINPKIDLANISTKSLLSL